MFSNPQLIGDMQVFAEVWRDEIVRKQAMLDRLGVTAKDLGSDEVFASLLRVRGVEPDAKETDKGNTSLPSRRPTRFHGRTAAGRRRGNSSAGRG